MKWFDKLFRRPPKNYTFAQTLNGLIPIYSQFGTNIYLSDVVQQAVKCIVDEIKKLNPTHVRYKGDDPTPIRTSTIQDVLSDPNPLMTTSEFLEKVTWLLMLNYNAFIVPVYKMWTDNGEERRDYEALYPINPTEVDFIEAARALIDQGVRRVFISAGPHGMLAADKNHMTMVDRYPAHVRCTTGAGDSAMAAIIWSSLKEGSDKLADPAKAANAAASATISVDPTIHPEMSSELIENIMNSHTIMIREMEID